jgi:arylsulfatase A-like enzyme/Tfp pilus assembly protein PilF
MLLKLQAASARSRRVVRGLVLVIVLVGVGWGWMVWRQPRLNVLIITLDTTRADRLGCYGYQGAQTPILDQLAARGALFEHAYTPAPLTLPAHSSLFTGLYPPEHGLRTNGKDRLATDIPTLATELRRRQYATGAFVASFVLDSKFGLDRGFQTYDDDLTGTTPADEALHRNRNGNVVVDRALQWLEGNFQQPFLCWVHLYDPHAPYVEHPELFGDQFRGRAYDAEIAFVDRQVARILEFLKTHQLSERTLVIVVGDHGEGLDEHQERRHGQMLYNSTMHVPLIVSLPGRVSPGQRIATPVSLVDLGPTILEQLGIPLKSRTSGRSLEGLLRGQADPSRGLYGETDEPFLESGWSPLRSLTTEKWKYIRTPKVELYDLTVDPDETTNLAVKEAAQVKVLEQQLAELERNLVQRQGAAVSLSPEEQRRLASLGYVGGQTVREAAASDSQLLDIKDMIVHYNSLEDARHMMDAGQLDQAAERLQAIVTAAPQFELAEIALGDVQLLRRDFAAANAVYRAVLKRNPESALAHCHLGDVQEAQGQFAAAARHYQDALQREPDSAKLHYNLGRTLVLQQNDQAAIPHFEAALELDPGYVFALVELGTALFRQGQATAALEYYETALKYDANALPAHLNAAMVLANLGRVPEVLSHLEAAVNISPRDAQIQFQLGTVLAAQGRATEAVQHLTEAVRLDPKHTAARELLDKLQPTSKARP